MIGLNKLILLASVMFAAAASAAPSVKGFNLTEYEGFAYNAAAPGQQKTHAQLAVDEIRRIGGNHVVLNVRAKMIGPHSNEIIPVTPPEERRTEARQMVQLIRYIHSQDMSVGIRPIFFVVGPNGEFPYYQELPNGDRKVWWHGNIQPADPNRWFESFLVYLNHYITIAKLSQADEFTVGAELYSMTVGTEDQWEEHPFGFPGEFLDIVRHVKAKLPQARVMYDINFTDAKVDTGNLAVSGGELERWRYRIVDLAEPSSDKEYQYWQDLVSLWLELDAIGIDMYRSLASRDAIIPDNQEELVDLLQERSNSYAQQLDTSFFEIAMITGEEKPVILKEIGFRSVEKAFIDPFTYATAGGPLNRSHQAASYEALFRSFWEVNWSWFDGFAFWDIPIDPARRGPEDRGFSPIGKPETEAVLQKYFY